MKLIGISGGSGSGKTTLARALQSALGSVNCEILYQDSYYRDQSLRFDHDGGLVNFDHPSALDFSLLAQHLKSLKAGQVIPVPIYDFATHQRRPESIPFHPKKWIVVDGILVLAEVPIRELFDFSIFVETPEELRFQRRLARDVAERGRRPEGVRQQFFKQVVPMHNQFVEPSKEFADEIYREVPPLEQYVSSLLLKLAY